MNKLKVGLTISLAIFWVQIGITQVQSTDNSAQKLDAKQKLKIIEEIAELVELNYVFSDIGGEIANYLRKKVQGKDYDSIIMMDEFISEITKDLQEVKNDAHLGLVKRRGNLQPGVSHEEMYKDFYLKRSYFQNFGFKKVDRLLGNIGFIILDEFSYIEMDGQDLGGQTAMAVMKVVSNTYALIIDLRDNFGGREEMALLLLDYLFENPTHLLTNKNSSGEDKEIWTKAEHQEGRLAEIPIYVLTSKHTISGGEMFAYVLQNRKRATIIGERTRGAAHKTHIFNLESAEIDIAIPLSTTIDPVTGSDWEGIGIEPDIAVSSGKAMDVAYKMALEEIMQGEVDEMELNEMKWTMMEVDAKINPIVLDESALEDFVGIFGERKFTVKDGILVYQLNDNSPYNLAPMSKDLFSFVDGGMFYARIGFSRNEEGVIDIMYMVYDTGKKREYIKTGFR